MHWDCKQADIKKYKDPCNIYRKSWNSNSYKNIMSYTSCRSGFTPQQIRRMRCWGEQFKNKYYL